MIAFKNWLALPIAISVLLGLVAPASAELISFEYTQTDKDTGSGTLSGTVNGISFIAAMPLATVAQNDISDLPIPAGMVGYMDGAANPSTNGNDFGVHLGWSGTVTLKGERQISDTELELYELDVPLVIADDGTPEADWEYSAEVTDDDGQGNDAFGPGFRIAGWVGEPREGHRHSGNTVAFVEGAIDRFTMGGTHNQVDENGRGDDLGINISFRDGPTDPDGGFLDGSGPVYVDQVFWKGGLTVDGSTNPERLVATVPLADLDGNGLVEMADFIILSSNFNLDGTSRSTGDLNADQRTDLFDFVIFRNAFNAVAGGATAAAVPEPSAGLSLLLGSLCLASLRRARRVTSHRSGSAV